jgi:hypothetical protein
MPSNREEISFQDLQAVLDAARLLRRYNLISVEQIRGIRGHVRADVDTIADRHHGQLAVEQIRALSALWDASRPTVE